MLYRRSHKTTYVLKLTAKDRLEKGSRFYGRLFPERCDLSPDGRLFVYFAMRGRLSSGQADPATWTAVCAPPCLKALVFCPNGSTWGGGGLFLRDRRLVLFDGDPESTATVRGYRIIHDTKLLTEKEQVAIMARFRRPASLQFESPLQTRRKKLPYLVRTLKPHVASGYDMFEYMLLDLDGSDVKGAEEVILANWAGWDARGRLLLAAGPFLKIYEIAPGKPFPDPSKVLDLEEAIA